MAARKSIFIEGLAELKKQLGGLKLVEEKLGPGRKAAALIIRASIKTEARPHKKDGDLERSIKINPKSLSKRRKNHTFVAIDRTIAPHADWVEFGANRSNRGLMRGDPFFTRGYLKAQAAASAALTASVQPAIDKSLG